MGKLFVTVQHKLIVLNLCSVRLGLSCIARLSQIALHVATINHPIIECYPWLLKIAFVI